MFQFAVRFKLRDVNAIEPWAGERGKTLSWFGLTDGCYCIETPAGRLFEFAGEVAPGLGEPWCQYQVARLFEDLIEIWPTVSDPVPEDIINYFQAWYRQKLGSDMCEVDSFDAFLAWQKHWENHTREVGDRALNAFYDVSEALGYRRHVDTLYLQEQPNFLLWRIGEEIHLGWDGAASWPPMRARLKFSYSTVKDALSNFFQEFLAQMDARVASIARDGWTGKECVLDVPRLIAEQIERSGWVAAAMTQIHLTDWALVRNCLKILAE